MIYYGLYTGGKSTKQPTEDSEHKTWQFGHEDRVGDMVLGILDNKVKGFFVWLRYGYQSSWRKGNEERKNSGVANDDILEQNMRLRGVNSSVQELNMID